MDQKNSEYGYFSGSVYYKILIKKNDNESVSYANLLIYYLIFKILNTGALILEVKF